MCKSLQQVHGLEKASLPSIVNVANERRAERLTVLSLPRPNAHSRLRWRRSVYIAGSQSSRLRLLTGHARRSAVAVVDGRRLGGASMKLRPF